MQSGTPVVATLSEAFYAYTWWPAKDGDINEPGDNFDKATHEFSITVSDLQRIKFGLQGQRSTDAPDQVDPVDCP